jgi:hypothetical protein
MVKVIEWKELVIAGLEAPGWHSPEEAGES